MQAHCKIVLDQRRAKKDNKYPVKIRVTLNRVQKYYPISIDLTPGSFDRIMQGSVRKDLRVIRDEIVDWEYKAKTIIRKLAPFSFEDFKLRLYNNLTSSIPDLNALFDQKITRLREKGKVSTANIYNEAKNSFINFNPKINLINITSDFLENYEIYMIDKGRSISTISMYIRSLRAVYNQAIM
jgi:hypothetical protein